MAIASPPPLSAGDILPRRTPYATWQASLAILGAIVFYVGGLTVWDRHTSPGPLVVPGESIAVGRGVGYLPAPGWAVDAPRVTPGKAHGVRHEALSFSVSVAEWKGSAREPFERNQRIALSAKEPRRAGADVAFTTPAGLAGTAVDVFGDNSFSRLWVAVDSARMQSIVMVAEGPPEQFRRHEGALQSMVDSVVAGHSP
jgi:hypothetical protein